MWCETQKNGTVKYCERYTDPLTEKIKKVTVTMPKDTPQNRKKAQRALNGKIDNALSMVNVSAKYTLEELCDAYKAAQHITCKASTTKRNNLIISYVLELLGEDIIIDNLTAQYVNNALLDSDKPISTLNTYITRFKAMLNWGYANDYHDNYRLVSKLKLFDDRSQKESTEDKFLEADEVPRLLEYMKKRKKWSWYYITHFLLLTGLRFGELAALENNDIDLTNLVIHINKTYDSNNDVVTTPKTDNSVRDIHIQPELLTLIKKARLWRKEALMEHGVSSPYFIPDVRTGCHVAYASYRTYLERTTEYLFGRQLTPHKLRHTHASLLAAAGMTPDEIARRLGHSHSDITRDIYIHVTKQVTQNDNDKLDNITLTS